MESELVARIQHLPTHLNSKEKEIAMIIWNVNLLIAYPLTDFQIEAWSKSINELRPNQDLKILESVINMMKVGAIEYNSRLGIQNIFKALKIYDKIKIGYVEQREQSQSRNPDTKMYETIFKKYFYYEDDVYPENMVWIVDKIQYESFNLKPTIPDTDIFLQELN